MTTPSLRPTVYRLSNTVQHYDWGSHTDIRGLLGTPDSGKPEAELWLGAHSSAPSFAVPWSNGNIADAGDSNNGGDGSDGGNGIEGHREANDAAAESGIPLNQLIQQNPVKMLGQRVLDEFGPRLPYLLKVLAADKALSLQVHPASHLARAGFNRENRENVPIAAPYRNYKDENHKPEMIVAVTEFHALAGLRAPRVILRMLEGLEGPLFDLIRAALVQRPNANGLRTALTDLLAQRENPNLPAQLADAMAVIAERAATNTQYLVADQTALELAEQHPGDVGALSSYLLNRVTLLPGEALYIGAGEAHAYIKGLGIEIMANSDNVLRAGLTSKHVEVKELLECMSFGPQMPFRPEQFEMGTASRSFSYRPPSDEFALTMLDLQGEPLLIHPGGPRILLVMEGEITVTYGGRTGLDAQRPIGAVTKRAMTKALPRVTGLPTTTLKLQQGESIFVPDAVGACEVNGNGQATCAWVP